MFKYIASNSSLFSWNLKSNYTKLNSDVHCEGCKKRSNFITQHESLHVDHCQQGYPHSISMNEDEMMFGMELKELNSHSLLNSKLTDTDNGEDQDAHYNNDEKNCDDESTRLLKSDTAMNLNDTDQKILSMETTLVDLEQECNDLLLGKESNLDTDVIREAEERKKQSPLSLDQYHDVGYGNVKKKNSVHHDDDDDNGENLGLLQSFDRMDMNDGRSFTHSQRETKGNLFSFPVQNWIKPPTFASSLKNKLDDGTPSSVSRSRVDISSRLQQKPRIDHRKLYFSQFFHDKKKSRKTEVPSDLDSMELIDSIQTRMFHLEKEVDRQITQLEMSHVKRSSS